MQSYDKTDQVRLKLPYRQCPVRTHIFLRYRACLTSFLFSAGKCSGSLPPCLSVMWCVVCRVCWCLMVLICSSSYTFNFLKDTGALADRFHWFTKERWHLIKFVHVTSPNIPATVPYFINSCVNTMTRWLQLTGKKPWQCVADHLCNVPGRQSAKIWDFWWAKMNEACDHLPLLSCDFR